jgi:high-affinity iron transporter
MLATVLITFRESLEALMVIGILFGFNRKFKLHKESFILKGALIGFLTGVLLVLGLLYLVFEQRLTMPADQFELLEQILLVFSGIFLIFVTLVIHPLISKEKNKYINAAIGKKDLSGFSLGTLSFTLVLLEGVETILFISSSSFTSSFADNIWGLLIGLNLAILASFLIYITYLKVHIQKLFKITEYTLFVWGIYYMIKGGWELTLVFFRH